MKINIRGDKVKITKAIRDYIESKIARLDRYFEKPEDIKAGVVVRVRNLEQIIEVTVPTSKYTLRAEEAHSDLYAAIDLVIDKLEAQIRKNKTRFKKRYQENEFLDFNLDFEEEEINDSQIVKRKNIEAQLMTEEEAILQMSLLNHDFFLFNNADENCYSVVYLRKDGQYGIINAK